MKAVALATKVPAALSTSLGWPLLRRGSTPCAAAGDHPGPFKDRLGRFLRRVHPLRS